VQETVTNFAEHGLNAVLYYKNKDFNNWVSLVPTSAITGEGIPDLLTVLIQLTQSRMTSKITEQDTFQATVLEVKVVEGLGMTIDVILVNGDLHVGDRVVLCGMEGPLATNIRTLLTPHPLRESRVRTPYIRHKTLHAAQGLKIAANGLERAVAGGRLIVVHPGENEEAIKEEAQSDLTDIKKKLSKRGVSVQASTLGSLEALLTFLEEMKVPVSAINIGPVHRSDVIRASINLDKTGRKEFGTILAFDVAVHRDAMQEAAKTGVKIFTHDIIYKLFEIFQEYMDTIRDEEKRLALDKVVYPCSLEILPDNVYYKKDPIVIGCRVKVGVLKLGTELCVVRVEEGKNDLRVLGKVTGIQDNHTDILEANVGAEVAVKIEGGDGLVYGRQFDHTDEIFSKMTRESIDVLKKYCKDVLRDKEILALIKKMKTLLPNLD